MADGGRNLLGNAENDVALIAKMTASLYNEDELLPLAGLADVVFCPRRAVLHRVDNLWEDSRHTIIGEHLHKKVHSEDTSERRGDLIIARGLRLRSVQLGVSGIADVVEFYAADKPDTGISLSGRRGRWIPYPVEYKKGILREQVCFDVQLCAQAICLEEMLSVSIHEGALFYGASRRRKPVEFTMSLREQTAAAAKLLHSLVNAGVPPLGEYAPKCKGCSLLEQCLPKTAGGGKSAAAWLAAQVDK